MNQYDFIYNKWHLDPQNHFLILCMIQSYYLYIHIQLVLQGIEQFVQVAAKCLVQSFSLSLSLGFAH